MNRNCSNQKPNPAIKTKGEINIYYKQAKDNENICPTEQAASFQKVASQLPKPK